jgi:hypothetical protein
MIEGMQMTDITVLEFCDTRHACAAGSEWAITHCTSMQEAWNTAKPEWVIWIAMQPGVLTDCELRRFACWSVRQMIWPFLTDERSRTAVEVAERFADGQATHEELSTARAAAWDAAWYAAWDAAGAAAGAAAVSAWDAAWYAAGYAARAAAVSAWDAAWYAAGYAARAAAEAAQADYLHTHCSPAFVRCNEVLR